MPSWTKNPAVAFVTGTALGVIGLFISLWFGLFPVPVSPKKDIGYSYTESKVFDIYRDIKGLNNLFNGDDIQANNMNLKIITITLQNIGETTIERGDYDEILPWGLIVKDGRIIDARISTASSDYLYQTQKIQWSDTSVMFAKIIFERGDIFAVEAVILHENDKNPSIETTGKISGISNFQISKPEDIETKRIAANRYALVITTVVMVCFFIVYLRYDMIHRSRFAIIIISFIVSLVYPLMSYLIIRLL